MHLRFVDPREIGSLADLSAVQIEQLRAAGKAYDGEDLPAEARLAGDAPFETEGSFLGSCQLWRVVRGDEHVYDAWLYMVDSGSFFRAGTTEEVAGIVQCGLECPDRALRAELGPAMVEARLLPHGDGSYQEFAAALAARGPTS